MPRFTGQNKKRINPRYFLNETMDPRIAAMMTLRPGAQVVLKTGEVAEIVDGDLSEGFFDVVIDGDGEVRTITSHDIDMDQLRAPGDLREGYRYQGPRNIMGRPATTAQDRMDRERGVTRGQYSDYQLKQAKKLGMHPRNITDKPQAPRNLASILDSTQGELLLATLQFIEQGNAPFLPAAKEDVRAAVAREIETRTQRGRMRGVNDRDVARMRDREILDLMYSIRNAQMKRR